MATRAFQIRSLQKAVASAGTNEAISSTKLFAKGEVTITALATNVGNMFLGDSTVFLGNGHVLVPGGSVSLLSLLGGGQAGGDVAAFDLNLIFVDTINNGDKVSVLYFEDA